MVSGPGAARVVFLDRAGAPLLDHEVTPGDEGAVAVSAPPGAERMAVSALGRVPGQVVAGPASVSLRAAPAGRAAVCGWQSGNHLAQVAPATLLARGATVHLPAPLVTRRDGRRTSQALIRAFTAVAGRQSCETWLPAGVDVVMVVVDAHRASPDEPGGLPRVSVDGAAVTGEPTVVVAGHRMSDHYSQGSPAGSPIAR